MVLLKPDTTLLIGQHSLDFVVRVQFLDMILHNCLSVHVSARDGKDRSVSPVPPQFLYGVVRRDIPKLVDKLCNFCLESFPSRSKHAGSTIRRLILDGRQSSESELGEPW